ncbi:MAG TPA: hypothetical protein VN207_12580 [Ktedonobacteraceae bacterium]|nr:hypothetical protein [Ktedonobacteraceae bacterium]
MSKAEQENQLPINNAVENLKTQYDFVQSNEISTFLKKHPSLIGDLNTVYETKSQYFKELPMTLYYISETGSLDSATLAAYIEMDVLTEETKQEFSRFRKEMWQKISKEAKHLITVGMD